MLTYQIRIHALLQYLTNRRGQGLVEYALLLVLIVIVLIAVVTFVGQNINNSYSTSINKLP